MTILSLVQTAARLASGAITAETGVLLLIDARVRTPPWAHRAAAVRGRALSWYRP